MLIYFVLVIDKITISLALWRTVDETCSIRFMDLKSSQMIVVSNDCKILLIINMIHLFTISNEFIGSWLQVIQTI